MMRALLWPLLMALSSCQSTAANPAHEAAAEPVQSASDIRYRGRYLGKISAPGLSEISGMAVSRRDASLLWVINDSGQTASLFAIAHDGSVQAEVKTSETNRDWESLTSLQIDGKPYLLVGDSGDNLGVHKEYRLHLFAEPVLAEWSATNTLSPVATTSFVYSDGPHNSEAVAYSPLERQVLLITKHAQHAAVYVSGLALEPGQTSLFSAQLVGQVARPPQSVSDTFLSNIAGVEMSQITGLEIDENSANAYVLTYRGIYQYPRHSVTDGDSTRLEDWALTFARRPRLLARHTLSQAEALARSPTTGTLYFTSEKLPAPLWRLEPGAATSPDSD